ncbi:MAG: ClpXP protease specificity-enhancing factor [Chromatiaceae bacterium]|nr:MAG: ClpXP protease specificity-enhancing factor [Chromatiaceae bacterium]
MTSNRPYLIRALFDWILDNGMTPHLLVDAESPGVFVPRSYIDDGRIVLNVAPSAVHGLVIGNDAVRFSARFGGVAHQVEIPPGAVLGIYARENGHGMLFPDEDPGAAEDQTVPTDSEPSDSTEAKPKRPSLRVVK